MLAKKFQRKIIFIKKAQQGKMLAFVLLAVLFGMSFVFYEYVNLLEDVFRNHPVLLHVFLEEGYGLLLGLVLKIAVCFGILALITAVLSNKISGPLYKMEITCKKVAEGDYSARIYLRNGDACGDLAKEFNDMMDKLEPKLRAAESQKQTDEKKGDNNV